MSQSKSFKRTNPKLAQIHLPWFARSFPAKSTIKTLGCSISGSCLLALPVRPRGHPAWCVACCLLSATLILRSLKGSYLLVCPPTKLKVPGASEDVSDGCYWYLVDRGQRVCAQSCPTLCNPMDCSRPGSSVHGILQARILEWVAISFSRGTSRPRDWTHASCLAGGFFTTEPPGKPEQRSGMLLNILQCTEYHSPPPTKAYPVQNVSNHEAEQHGPEMFHIWRPRSLEAPALPHSSTF